jgi:prophage DNA circulation protein
MDSIGNIGTAWDSYFASGEGPSSTGATPSQAPSAASPASSDMRAAYLLATGQRLIGLMDGLPAVTGSTIMQLAKAANQRALMMLVKSCVTLATAKVAVRIPYASSDSATSMRAALVDMLDACVELTDDDAAYAAIVRLRSTVVEHLTGVATNLPKIVTYTPAETTPALVIAQQLYGSSALAQDLIDRNDIENPACVAGGVELEVLSA